MHAFAEEWLPRLAAAGGAPPLLDFLAALGTLKNSAYTRGFLAAKAEALDRLQA